MPDLPSRTRAAAAHWRLMLGKRLTGAAALDFISKNLVTDDTAPVGWVAIDPLPMVGERATDVAAFAAYRPAEQILPVAEALAVRLRLDPRRVLGWTAIKTVHQTAQAWRDDQAELERLVRSEPITELLRRPLGHSAVTKGLNAG